MGWGDRGWGGGGGVGGEIGGGGVGGERGGRGGVGGGEGGKRGEGGDDGSGGRGGGRRERLWDGVVGWVSFWCEDGEGRLREQRQRGKRWSQVMSDEVRWLGWEWLYFEDS